MSELTPMAAKRTLPIRRPNAAYQQREYLTEAEVEKLIEAARKRSRSPERDAAAILLAYRHGGLVLYVGDRGACQDAPFSGRCGGQLQSAAVALWAAMAGAGAVSACHPPLRSLSGAGRSSIHCTPLPPVTSASISPTAVFIVSMNARFTSG
jgi:hypothetical protein